ncbi:hypothetical protein NP233_g2436 [Leucocoprinus birnbaumii]|uniref:AB hydrolase-1 domain-containing protein n=1 Tax=Leucocoprinus birnbaumii TaxID=56174 RepID=A0AAD5W2A9_9AGAR|nr:hypothetical protein NP233_g2436 [Leucocoprinus birnbaumii]
MKEYFNDQLGATIQHADGAIMTYDVLGVRHFAAGRVPIVLIGGMTSLRGDWERLANALAEVRPVLLLDHRGMGDSTYTPAGDEEITIELYARDIVDLLLHLKWPRLAICGFSMGGAIAQQILLLPFHRTSPVQPYPFEITHVFLTATLASPMRTRGYGLKIRPPPPPKDGIKRTKEEKKEIARPILEATFDENWMNDPRNKERFEMLLDRMIYGRPAKTILQQARTLNILHFDAPHALISSSIPILVIHGMNDRVIPFAYSEEILSLIPHARAVGIGNKRGQVPSLKFGHQWFEYFDVQVWVGVVEEFMGQGGHAERTKL